MGIMKTGMCMVCGLLAAGSVVAEVYQYKNEQGQTVFSDVPTADAKAVEIKPVMTYTPQVKTLPSAPVKQDVAVGAYESIVITSPQQEGTVRDNQGIVRVRYALVPALQKGDKAILYLDGRANEVFDLKGIERGEHHVEVAIVDVNGTEKIRSNRVTFYLHHQSKLLNK